MEIDDLKLAWHTLDRHLQQSHALNLQLVRDRKLDTARRHLRPLWWGQLLQMAFGVMFVLLGVSIWSAGRDLLPVLATGVIAHVYGIALIVMSGITLGLIQRIDYAAPVVTIQKQLVQLRRFYVISGMAVGLPWWLLWMLPFLLMLPGLDTDPGLQSWLPPMLYFGTALGVAGLLGTWWLHRWSRNPSRPQLARRMQDAVTGGSLRRAQARLDEIAEFERS